MLLRPVRGSIVDATSTNTAGRGPGRREGGEGTQTSDSVARWQRVPEEELQVSPHLTGPAIPHSVVIDAASFSGSKGNF
jgi:hypothetical protein